MQCIALILALLAAGAADASAATVSAAVEIGDNGRATTFTTVVRYTAAAGEANRLGARQEGDVWRITDSGAPVAASGLCEAVGEHEAVSASTRRTTRSWRCSGTAPTRRSASGRCWSTAARATTGWSPIAPSDGNDLLVGGSGRDVLRGGPRVDEIDPD